MSPLEPCYAVPVDQHAVDAGDFMSSKWYSITSASREAYGPILG